ncbi:IclR family transcriptional regulator [Microbacterium gorillae]|uniref:IclR family transcriptional regulator n=1 Tax=Microbacterium gorillae TaxID=1231063 RepID=UPI003D97C982
MSLPDDAISERTSMGRGMDVISCLADMSAAGEQGVSVQDIARALERDRSQISRTLAALAEEQLVSRGSDGRYRLAWSWYASAEQLVERRLRVEGRTILDELSESAGEACFLGVLEGDATVTIVESVPTAARLIGSWIGRAYPAFCSDAGQAVLWDASDDEVRGVFSRTEFRSAGPNAATSVDEFLRRLAASRERGYAIVAEEAEPGLYSVSAPVWDFRGEVIAGMQIVGERRRLEPRSPALGEACADAARRLSAMLGARES